MRRVMLTLATLLLASPLRADDDAQEAPPLRWYDPRGCAGGTRRSAALPVTSQPQEFWSATTRLPVVATPITWDGRLYLYCSDGERNELVALDLFRGHELARRSLPNDATGQAVVWDDRIYLRISENEVGEYVLAGKGFNETWRHKFSKMTCDPVVYRNEIYLSGGRGSARFSPTRREYVWMRGAGRVISPPVVVGKHVCLPTSIEASETIFRIGVSSHSRAKGTDGVWAEIAWYDSRKGMAPAHAAELLLAPGRLFLRSAGSLEAQGGLLPWASCAYEIGDAGLRARGEVSLHQMQDRSAAVHRKGMISRGIEKGEGCLVEYRPEDGSLILCNEREHPDLFGLDIPPTVLGDIVYFGNWAADIETREILWRLPLPTIRFPVVPADRMFVVVDGLRSLRAYHAGGSGR